MALEFGLSTSATEMTFLDKMNPSIPCPDSALEEWTTIYVNSDGSYTGDGFPREIWTWDILTQEEVNKLRTFVGSAFGAASANVYLRTKLPDGTFDTFTAVMQWPRDIHTRRDMLGRYRRVSITFSGLELAP